MREEWRGGRRDAGWKGGAGEGTKEEKSDLLRKLDKDRVVEALTAEDGAVGCDRPPDANQSHSRRE